MRYYAKPVAVEAFVIDEVAPFLVRGELHVRTEDGVVRTATAAMMARFQPSEGDVWVIQQDGYEYVNPRDVFERKYSATPPLFDVKVLGASIQVKITPTPEPDPAAELDDDERDATDCATAAPSTANGLGGQLSAGISDAGIGQAWTNSAFGLPRGNPFAFPSYRL